MIECGYDDAALNAMNEEEFLYWFEKRIDYDQQVAEAKRKAAEKGGKSK